MPKVIMWSDVYGLEEFNIRNRARGRREGFERLKATCRHQEFDFETEQEAREGFERLKSERAGPTTTASNATCTW